MEQANEEADHKGWCDTELSTNEQTRREKSSAVESLTIEIDGLESSIAQLGNQLAEISQSVAEINAAVAKATALRQKEEPLPYASGTSTPYTGMQAENTGVIG